MDGGDAMTEHVLKADLTLIGHVLIDTLDGECAETPTGREEERREDPRRTDDSANGTKSS